jgi:hypothetical protein
VPAFDNDDIAAPLAKLQAAVQQTARAIRDAFADPKCQLLWRESTYGRVHSLAALSHQCVFLEQMGRLAVESAPSEVLGRRLVRLRLREHEWRDVVHSTDRSCLS